MKTKPKDREKKRQLVSFSRWIKMQGSGSAVYDLCGTDIYFLREWLSEKFKPEMNWDNYGTVWVVDHIVPIRLFNIFDEAELKVCWNYRNLMPLLKEDNLKKEGNAHFAYNLLLPLRDMDWMYEKLFKKIEAEVREMDSYAFDYQKTAGCQNQ